MNIGGISLLQDGTQVGNAIEKKLLMNDANA
jgi:hypothetical protein